MHIMCEGEQNAHFLVINLDQLRKMENKMSRPIINLAELQEKEKEWG